MNKEDIKWDDEITWDEVPSNSMVSSNDSGIIWDDAQPSLVDQIPGLAPQVIPAPEPSL